MPWLASVERYNYLQAQRDEGKKEKNLWESCCYETQPPSECMVWQGEIWGNNYPDPSFILPSDLLPMFPLAKPYPKPENKGVQWMWPKDGSLQGHQVGWRGLRVDLEAKWRHLVHLHAGILREREGWLMMTTLV